MRAKINITTPIQTVASALVAVNAHLISEGKIPTELQLDEITVLNAITAVFQHDLEGNLEDDATFKTFKAGFEVLRALMKNAMTLSAESCLSQQTLRNLGVEPPMYTLNMPEMTVELLEQKLTVPSGVDCDSVMKDFASEEAKAVAARMMARANGAEAETKAEATDSKTARVRLRVKEIHESKKTAPKDDLPGEEVSIDSLGKYESSAIKDLLSMLGNPKNFQVRRLDLK